MQELCVLDSVHNHPHSMLTLCYGSVCSSWCNTCCIACGYLALALQANTLKQLREAEVANIPTLWHEGQLQTQEHYFIAYPLGAGVDFSLTGMELLRIVRDAALTLSQMHNLCEVGRVASGDARAYSSTCAIGGHHSTGSVLSCAANGSAWPSRLLMTKLPSCF
jgi:hypothetical protein